MLIIRPNVSVLHDTLIYTTQTSITSPNLSVLHDTIIYTTHNVFTRYDNLHHT